MPFIRLSDNYINHPKFLALSDGAFRLWHEGMAYTRMHQTDGVITFKALKTFQAFTKGREKQLSTPHAAGAAPLWELVRATGYTVHDYLDWNPSREEENERRAESKERMRVLRDQRRTKGVPPVCANVRTNDAQTNRERSHDVLEKEKDPDRGFGSSSEKSSVAHSDANNVSLRAGRLLQEDYPRWYAEERKGARLRIVANSLAFQDAMSIVAQWDDARIEQLARIVLTTDDDWIAKTDRSFKIFALKASWADDRLRQWEAKQAVGV